MELLGARELQQVRPQLVAELGNALGAEALDRLPRLGQHLAIGAEARRLDREDEARRRCLSPALEGRRLLAAVISGVDLDRGHMGRGIFKLARLGQVVRIEDTPPGLVGPSPDADPNGAAAHALAPSSGMISRAPGS